jgi:hypothetical protein
MRYFIINVWIVNFLVYQNDNFTNIIKRHQMIFKHQDIQELISQNLYDLFK